MIWCWRSNVQMNRKLIPFWGSHNIAPLSRFLVPRNFSIDSNSHPTSSLFLFLYLFLPQPYSSLAVNSLGNSQLNSFSSSSSSYRLSSSASSPYSLSNSSTSSFVFPKFFLSSHMSSSAVYPFYHTKNFSFPHTILLFRIFSTSNSSSPSMMTGFGGVFFCPSTYGLYSYHKWPLTNLWLVDLVFKRLKKAKLDKQQRCC